MALMPFGSPPDKWDNKTYGSGHYLEPKDMSKNLLIGNPLHSSLSTAFPGATALFNGQTTGASDGGNYFMNAAYGVSFGAFGGVFVGAHALGTASAPTQTTAGNWLGGLIFTGYSGTTWNINGATHLVPGFWASAATNVTGSTLESDIYMGGLLTRMISFETDTNAIKFNEALLDSDITFYHDTNVAMFIQGSDGFVGIGDSSPTTRLMVMPNAAYAAPTLGTVSGGFSVHGDQTTYGFFLGVANTGTTWMQSMRKDGSATAYGLSLQPSGGGVGVGVMSPTSYLHLRAGTTAASGAPLKFTTGSNMTTAEVGAMEFSSNVLHFTPSGTTRRVVLLDLLPDAQNISFGTTTGTKIGTGATQKIGWWDATPVVQDTGWSVTGGYTADRAFDPETASALEVARVLGTLVDQLKTYGILGA